MGLCVNLKSLRKLNEELILDQAYSAVVVFSFVFLISSFHECMVLYLIFSVPIFRPPNGGESP